MCATHQCGAKAAGDLRRWLGGAGFVRCFSLLLVLQRLHFARRSVVDEGVHRARDDGAAVLLDPPLLLLGGRGAVVEVRQILRRKRQLTALQYREMIKRLPHSEQAFFYL